MGDSPTKRARERRKAQRRREKSVLKRNRPVEEDSEENVAARYLEPSEEDVEASEEDEQESNA